MSARSEALSRIPLTGLLAGWSTADIRVVRYAFGATAAAAVALGAPWMVSYLVPVLVVTFLAVPDTPITPKFGVALVAIVGATTWLGWQVGRLVAYPGLLIPMSALLLFWIFHAAQRGRSTLVVVWLLIAVMILPLAILASPAIGAIVAMGLFRDAVVTAVICVLAYQLLPERPAPATAGSQGGAAAPVASPREAFRGALISTAVVLPVVIVLYFYEAMGAIVMLAFIGLLSSQPAIAQNVKAGRGLVVANIAGGLVAIVLYNLIVIVPSLPFMLLLVLGTGLFMGTGVFSGRPVAPLFKTGFATVLFIIGSTTTSGDDAGSVVYVRVLQIALAVIYVVVAFRWMNRLFPARR